PLRCLLTPARSRAARGEARQARTHALGHAPGASQRGGPPGAPRPAPGAAPRREAPSAPEPLTNPRTTAPPLPPHGGAGALVIRGGARRSLLDQRGRGILPAVAGPVLEDDLPVDHAGAGPAVQDRARALGTAAQAHRPHGAA